MDAATITTPSASLAALHLRAAAGNHAASVLVDRLVMRWKSRRGLLAQDKWWVPVDGWVRWADGETLGCLRTDRREITAVANMGAKWRSNLVAMLESMCPELLEGRWLCALRDAAGDREGASADEIAALIDDPAAGLAWLASQPLLVALRAGATELAEVH